MPLLPDPIFDLLTHSDDALCTSNTIMVGCVSYEERCKGAITTLMDKGIDKINVMLFDIEDDECTHTPWRVESKQKTEDCWADFLLMMTSKGLSWKIDKNSYKMSKRREHVFFLIENIKSYIDNLYQGKLPVRVMLDITCMPSYFALQLLKSMLAYEIVADLVILYSKPVDYPEKTLKVSPYDKTSPDFLPLFGHRERSSSVKWIVGVGFDNDSVCNALRIKENIEVSSTFIVVPFPGYRPEYVVRSMTENENLLKSNKHFHFAQADSPFKTYSLISEIVYKSTDFILSSFGPKPMAVGFALAAHKYNLPILHVQATNYNPNFSVGIRGTSCYWVKQNYVIWDN